MAIKDYVMNCPSVLAPRQIGTNFIGMVSPRGRMFDYQPQLRDSVRLSPKFERAASIYATYQKYIHILIDFRGLSLRQPITSQPADILMTMV